MNKLTVVLSVLSLVISIIVVVIVVPMKGGLVPQYCWEFDPTTDITAYELASIFNIYDGADKRHDAAGSLEVMSSKAVSLTGNPGTFIDRQFKRCDND